MMALRELAEELEVETFAIDLGDARLSGRTQVRRTPTGLAWRCQYVSLIERAGA